ncbi:MAG: tetratricopeptide repeat protein [Alphaproteobacteria bacterium]
MQNLGLTVLWHRFRLALTGILAVVMLGGCAHEGVGSPLRRDKLQVAAAESAFGNYLAGRFANTQRDTSLAATFYGRALAEDPHNQVILQRTFLLDISDGRMDDAQELARRIVLDRSNDRLARLVLAIDAFKHHKHAVARRHLDRTGDGPFTELVESLVRAWSYADQRQTKKAVEILDEVASNTGLHGFTAFQKALIYEIGLRTGDAEKAYAVAREDNRGGGLRVVQAYGRFLERIGRTDAAIAVYEDYLERVSDSRIVAEDLARAHAGLRPPALAPNARAGLAEAIFGVSAFLAARHQRVDLPLLYLQLALHLRPNFPASRILLADLYGGIKRYSAAIRILGGVDRTSIYARQARIQIAQYLHKMGRNEEAIASMRRLAAEDPQDLESVATLATMLRMSSRFAEAADVYGQAIAMLDEVKENHWPLFFYHGVSLERSGRWPEAEDSLKQALRLNGDQPEVLNYLAYSWIDRGQRVREAMGMVKRALEIRAKVERRPNDGYLIDSLGWAHFRLGEYDKAVRHLERAAELEPGDPSINEHLGDAYWMAGRRIEARFQWERVLKLKPGAEHSRVIRRKLEFGLTAPTAAATGTSGS